MWIIQPLSIREPNKSRAVRSGRVLFRARNLLRTIAIRTTVRTLFYLFAKHEDLLTFLQCLYVDGKDLKVALKIRIHIGENTSTRT